jgi:hypothetical protein
MTQPPYVPGQQPYQPSPYGQQPVPPGYQQPPPGWPPPQPAKKRGPLVWILGIVGGVFGLCLAIGIIGAATDSNSGEGVDQPAAAGTEKTQAEEPSTAGEKTAATKAPAKKIAGIGDKVRDGKFEFVVTKMDCSKTRVGDEFLNAKAQGRFCLVSVSVTNIGDEPQLFTGANQTAYAGKTEFKNDTGAEFYANDDSQTFLEEINPGNSVKGNLVFDVPKATKLTEIELHDGFFSGGVRVSLS